MNPTSLMGVMRQAGDVFLCAVMTNLVRHPNGQWTAQNLVGQPFGVDPAKAEALYEAGALAITYQGPFGSQEYAPTEVGTLCYDACFPDGVPPQ